MGVDTCRKSNSTAVASTVTTADRTSRQMANKNRR